MISADTRALVLTARFAEGRYHGEPEWPPSPARLFQALVAGCAQGAELDPHDAAALEWLERLPPPLIAAPVARTGQSVKIWVPNNDLDAKGGDPDAVATIRTGKRVRPRIFDPGVPLVYAWTLADDDVHATRVCVMARALYQLGRGADVASATASVLEGSALSRLLDEHTGVIHRPSVGGENAERTLECPQRGSLSSLTVRHRATLARFSTEGKGRSARDIFQQPPKPRFAPVAYDVPVARALFDLRPVGERMDAFSATPLPRVGAVTEVLRDEAAARLAKAVPGIAADIERGLIGRKVEGLAPVSPERRVRIVPLPSIGHQYADLGVRRVVVDVPSGNPLRAGDVFWAFSGLEIQAPAGADVRVTRADDRSMLEHYGIEDREAGARRQQKTRSEGKHVARGARRWQTVTPAALPIARRRIEPSRLREEAKPASERSHEEARAAHAVLQALRHAGIRTPVTRVDVQREPFGAKGARAEAFAPGTRFPKGRLWHVDITFRDGIAGPLVLGDGRFLGLGLMAPVDDLPGVFAFQVGEGLAAQASPLVIAEALRRAVMARFQAEIGEKERLPAFVTGHEADGRPARDTPHVSFAYDPEGQRVLVIAPHAFRHRCPPWRERRYLPILARALERFTLLRAGRAGALALEPEALSLDRDPLFAPSRRWVSRTPYVANRHLRAADASAALAADLEASIRSAGLPEARVQVDQAWGEPGAGLMGTATLEFEVAIAGPLMLGRTRHKGGGLFAHR